MSRPGYSKSIVIFCTNLKSQIKMCEFYLQGNFIKNTAIEEKLNVLNARLNKLQNAK